MRKVTSILLVSLVVISGFMILFTIMPKNVQATTTHFVGGTGGGNYTHIQWAIENASDGDTVFVYNGTYYEHVVVNKTINLTGENRDTTIINGSCTGDVVYVTANWVNITGFTMMEGGSTWDAGIELNNAQNCSIINNNVSLNNMFGIYLLYSSNNDITNNDVYSNLWSGILLYEPSNNNTITGNNVSNNMYGIYIRDSSNNNISGNNISKNKYDGIYSGGSTNNDITNNDVYSNLRSGISLSSSSNNNDITANIVSSNNRDGINVHHSSDYNIITDNNVSSNNYMGITVDYSRGNIITRNNATSNSNQGIFLYTNSRGNTITDNNMTNNGYGIEIRDSGGNNITRNTISNNGWGIYLRDSKWINITDNNMTNNGIFINGDSIDLWNTHDIKTSNTINGKPVYYWKDKTGGVIPSNASQVILANCTKIEVEGLELNYASVGIEMGFSLNNNVTGNTASDNYYGIFIKNSDDNNITYNNVSSNVYGLYFYLSDMNNITGNSASLNILDGIYFYQSNRGNISSNIIASNERFGFNIDYSKWNNITYNNIYLNHDCGLDLSFSAESNKIYHNNFFDNTNQASDPTDNKNQWDDGYPFGGNYWSDYGGEDHYMGINQNIHGRDGIGDMNYTIDSDSIDRYPLMGLFPLFPTANYTIFKQGWNLISIPLIQEEQNLTKVLEMIDGYYDAVQWYDTTDINDSWKHHKISKSFGNDLFELNESMGFWIHITNPEDTIFLYNGTQPPQNQTITLHPGWNMVGYPSLTSYNRTEGLNNLTFNDQVDAIWSYDAATQKWEEMGESDYFEIGRGYYIHAKSECEWEVPL